MAWEGSVRIIVLWIRDRIMVKRNPRAAITVGIYRDLYDRIKARGTTNGIKEHINQVLENNPENSEFLKRYFSDLRKIRVNGGSMYIEDTRKGIVAEVTLSEMGLYCKTCWLPNCTHIHFALAQTDLFLLNSGVGCDIPTR